jgi:small-conductance mechanosensitive channel
MEKSEVRRIEQEIVEDAEAHKAVISFWIILLFTAFFLSILKMGVLSGYIGTPQLLYDYDRAITAFIVIAFTKLWLTAIHPFYKAVSVRFFKTYAAAKGSWRFFTYIVWIIVLVAALIYIGGYQNLALSVGLVSAAVVYVLQVPILNTVAWLYISTVRPYRIGDRIEIGDKKGDVVDIGIMHTSIREINNWLDGDMHTGRLISIPNKEIFEGGVRNYTIKSPYIWDSVKVSVTYESNHEKARKIIEEVMRDVVGEEMKTLTREVMKMADFPELADVFITRPTVFVSLADSSVIMEGVYACKSHERSKVHSEITRRILERFSKEDDVDIAYPHMHIIGGVNVSEQ